MPTPGQHIPAVTPERFAQGRTFTEYLTYLGSEANLVREGFRGGTTREPIPNRDDMSGAVRAWYDSFQLTDAQVQSMRTLVKQPNGPRSVLVIAEEWSSDCRRDVPVFKRLAEAGNDLELRIFNRDGDRYSDDPEPTDSPNADLMSVFLNRKPGGPYQSVPVAAFFDAEYRYLYHHTEYPTLYRKDQIQAALRAPREGESAVEPEARYGRDWLAVRESPFFRVWASACADEVITGLYMRVMLGLNPDGSA